MASGLEIRFTGYLKSFIFYFYVEVEIWMNDGTLKTVQDASGLIDFGAGSNDAVSIDDSGVMSLKNNYFEGVSISAKSVCDGGMSFYINFIFSNLFRTAEKYSRIFPC